MGFSDFPMLSYSDALFWDVTSEKITCPVESSAEDVLCTLRCFEKSLKLSS